MKLLILGATGATGQLLVQQALAAGHEVTALVRNPAQVTTSHPNFKAVKGQATVAADVEPLMRGQDAVLSALGPRTKNDPVCADAASAVVSAMQNAGVKRLVWLSAGGVGDSKAHITAASFVFGRIILPLFLAKPYANHLRAEEVVRASGLDWTLVRPAQLVDQATGNPVVAVLPDQKVGGLKIARADVAAFMLGEVGAREYVGLAPTLHA